MNRISRRGFVKAAAATLGAIAAPALLGSDKARPKVLVVGGGYGGAIAAKYIQMMNPDLRVTLIERRATYVSCPMSNEVLAGERDLEGLSFHYRGLAGRGITVLQDEIVAIDHDQRLAIGTGDNRYPYDKLIVSPGIGFRWDAIDGLSAEVANTIPHAWQAGPQTIALQRQLEAMPDGGVFAIVAPPNPFRCPPGPYERAAQVAHYFTRHKPRSKILILDAKDAFSKQGLFTAGWRAHYGDMIEWVSGASGGLVEGIDPQNKTLIGLVDDFKADVINLIPPQKAGPLAEAAGLTDQSGWCPVDQRTFESSIHPGIYVIGDACLAGAMPKSGYAANSQGKVCAAAVVAALAGNPPPEPSYVSTCYSIIAPDHAISVAAVYELKDGRIVAVPDSGGLSPADADARTRAMEAHFAHAWFRNITADMFT